MIGRTFVVHDERTVSIGGKIEYLFLFLFSLTVYQYVFDGGHAMLKRTQ